MLLLKISSHFKRVTALFCEMLLSENYRTPKYEMAKDLTYGR